MTRYVTVDELVYLNEQLPNPHTIHKILSGKDRVRDMTQLDAAALRPVASAFGADAFPTPEDKAAALLHAIARWHPFVDGNKRTATLAAIFLLAINGRRVAWDRADALTRIIDVAEGRCDVADFAAWLPTEPTDSAPEPDADRDKALIAAIIADHAWLLAELAER